jgi:transcriptional regulatory protein RtcR
MARRKLVVIGLLGTSLDAGRGNARWDRWRPTVSITQHEDLVVDRLELIHGRAGSPIADIVTTDIKHASPETRVNHHVIEFKDPWDFEAVYGTLHDFARAYPFDTEREDYLVHITTGTHVAQICLFLLTESRYFPARLLQTSPGVHGQKRSATGTYSIIDLDLSRYDRLGSRFRKEQIEGRSFLKFGIETKNASFNALIDRIQHVAIASQAPVLLTGPTGAGKSKLARRIFELKKARRQITGAFAEINCATLRGDSAMSALFGHKKGAFTGAVADRPGLLVKANGGVVFLDEVGELGLDEQAMLLHAIEEKVFTPLGSDRETSSDFQLLCGTNRDLRTQIARGAFRDDLFARINLWTFRLPALHERAEDIPPNLDFELDQASKTLGVNVTMSREARDHFLDFASTWNWVGNFRDLNASITRMATLATGGRITTHAVTDELALLKTGGSLSDSNDAGADLLLRVLGSERAARLDRFDRVQLQDVLTVCRNAKSLSSAGRDLFASSRAEKRSANDADRLKKYLARFELDFGLLKNA